MAVGGSIESLSIKGRTFAVAADAGAKRHLGGFENAVEANGDGTARLIKTRVPWSLAGIAVVIDDGNDDQKFLQDIADSKEFVPTDITFASGAVFSGTGQIVDKLEYDSQKATQEISLAGPANLSKQ